MAVAFESIYQQVLARVGGEDALLDRMPTVRPMEQLAILSDDRYLSAIVLRIFRAGLKHSMVNSRWPKFEAAFASFNPAVLAAASDEELEQRMQRDGVIKHWAKVKAVRHNAQFVAARSVENGSFGRWIAAWPVQDITGLWQELAQSGAMLGGKSGASFLRYIGKDTPLLSDDVIAVLTEQGLISGNPMTKKNLASIQRQFNEWHIESDLPYSHISRIVSMTVNQPEPLFS